MFPLDYTDKVRGSPGSFQLIHLYIVNIILDGAKLQPYSKYTYTQILPVVTLSVTIPLDDIIFSRYYLNRSDFEWASEGNRSGPEFTNRERG